LRGRRWLTTTVNSVVKTVWNGARSFARTTYSLIHHDGFHGCCNDFELDEVEIFDFGFLPWYYLAADDLEYCFWEYEGEGEWEYECEDLD
jgi:hypothetical protein